MGNTHKRFSELYREAIEQSMSTPTSSNGLNASGSSPVKIQIGRDATVEQLGQKPVTPSADISTMGEQFPGPATVIRPVDHIALEGTHKGDWRSGNVDRIPAVPQPTPRQPMTQFPLSGRTPAAPAPQLSSVESTEGDRA